MQGAELFTNKLETIAGGKMRKLLLLLAFFNGNLENSAIGFYMIALYPIRQLDLLIIVKLLPLV